MAGLTELTEQVGYEASAAAKTAAEESLDINRDCAVEVMVRLAMTAIRVRNDFMMLLAALPMVGVDDSKSTRIEKKQRKETTKIQQTLSWTGKSLVMYKCVYFNSVNTMQYALLP